MALRIIVAVAIGGALGLVVGLIGQNMGAQCPFLCNPYVSTGLGIAAALLLASRTQPVEAIHFGPNVAELRSSEAYGQALATRQKPVLLMFMTSSCPACHRQAPVLDRVADRFAGRAVVGVVNASDLPEERRQQEIRVVPTLVVFQDGQRVEKVPRLQSEAELVALLEKYAGPPPAPTGKGAPPAT